jgi:hypothetical protein
MKTKKCHFCDRHSFEVARGLPCPHCFKYPKRFISENKVLAAVAIAALISAAYVLSQL